MKVCLVGLELTYVSVLKSWSNPANIYLLKVNHRNSRKRGKICSKLTLKTHKQLWMYFSPFSNVSVVEFEQVNTFWEVYLRIVDVLRLEQASWRWIIFITQAWFWFTSSFSLKLFDWASLLILIFFLWNLLGLTKQFSVLYIIMLSFDFVCASYVLEMNFCYTQCIYSFVIRNM